MHVHGFLYNPGMGDIRLDDRRAGRGAKRKSVSVRDVAVPADEMGFAVHDISDEDTMAFDGTRCCSDDADLMEDEDEGTSSSGGSGGGSGSPIRDFARGPSELVKVKFEKFVQLVATHNFEEVLKRYPDEDIVLGSNLLMDLASAHEDVDDGKRQPILIGLGVVIGLVIAFLVFRFF